MLRDGSFVVLNYFTDMLGVGDKAPAILAQNQDGENIGLDKFTGKKIILYFYPKDNTPGCTVEAKNMRDGKEELKKRGFEIVGVSPDSVKSHESFCRKHELNFTLLSDPDATIAKAFGVWGEKKFMGKAYMGILRTTFIIDENGLIEKVFTKVDTKNHWQQIIDSYKK